VHTRTAARRISLILFLMCAVVCLQTASIASEPFHQHSSQHCCGLCHAGPLPFLQTTVTASVAPVLAQTWLEQSSGLTSAHDVLLAAGSSRAPPA
jgi:hypothetical protein